MKTSAEAALMIRQWIIAAIDQPTEMKDLVNQASNGQASIDPGYYLAAAAHYLTVEYTPETREAGLEEATCPLALSDQTVSDQFYRHLATVRDLTGQPAAQNTPDLTDYLRTD